ncbi:MAG: Cof-type HAD-IIB family hydrolase [Armatimonadota bacterium]|nr:Cof-type HAD-IIB family hydrolase [Armatimonadota bacterium]
MKTLPYRLAAIDLDGTLLGSDLTISPRAREAIRRARAAGCTITLCTGRMYASALPYALELGLDVPLITYHGALVKTAPGGEVLYRRFVPLALARRVVTFCQERGFPVNVYYGDGLFVERHTPESAAYGALARRRVEAVGDLLAFMQDDPIKLVALAAPDRLVDLARLEEEWRATHGDALYVTRSQPEFLEFMHPEATKRRGLLEVARRLGVRREEIMAVGDSWNDLEMFRAAGLAVAMGNAPAEVQREADYVTARVEDDGVAEALERFVLSAGDGPSCP